MASLSAKQASDFAACWFIRHHFERMSDERRIFPDSLKSLCSSFIGILLNDEWEKESDKKQRIEVFGDDNEWIRRTYTKYHWNTCIFGKKIVDYSYVWRLRIGECDGPKFGSLIGIVPNKNIVDPNNNGDFLVISEDDHRFDISPYNGYSFWSYSKHVQHGDLRKVYGDYLRKDSVIEIVLNMKERTINFVIDGMDHGVAFTEIQDTAYRLAAVIYNNDQIQIL